MLPVALGVYITCTYLLVPVRIDTVNHRHFVKPKPTPPHRNNANADIPAEVHKQMRSKQIRSPHRNILLKPSSLPIFLLPLLLLLLLLLLMILLALIPNLLL